MKKKLLNLISTISLVLVMAFSPLFIQGLNSSATGENLKVITRTLSVNESVIDCESVFNSYEDAKLETNGSLTTFEGTQKLKLSDLEGLDEVSKSELGDAELNVKYQYSFDYVTDKVTLSVIMVEENENGELVENVVDTIEGTAFVNEDGQIDAELDLDGETILLSELQQSGAIDNCGWFKNLCKKVSKAVKKVTKTVIGVIGAVATVAVPAALGVICAASGVGLIATIAIGAVTGAAIAAGTAAASTAQQDGKVDWETVGVCAGVGGVVGAVASGVAYGATKAVQAAKAATAAKTAVPKADIGNKLDYAFGKASGNAHNINRSMENASQLSKIGVYDNPAGREILTEHFNKALADNSAKILAQNAGRVEVSTLLSGPGGFLNVKSIWEGAKLITFIFIG